MMRPGWTAKPRQAHKYQEPHAPSDGITGDTICDGFPRGRANALPFSCKPAAESVPRLYTMSLRRDCQRCNGLFDSASEL
jgi:hypothetical protein